MLTLVLLMLIDQGVLAWEFFPTPVAITVIGFLAMDVLWLVCGWAIGQALKGRWE